MGKGEYNTASGCGGMAESNASSQNERGCGVGVAAELFVEGSNLY